MSGYLRDSQLRRQLEEKVKEATRTRQVAEESLKAAREVVEGAKRIDADVVEASKPLVEAEAAFAAKDYKLASDKAAEAKERGTRIYRERVTSILESSGNLASLGRSIGADVGEADQALARARDALGSDDLPTATEQAKRAWKRSEKVLLEHQSSSFSKAQSLLLAAKNLGRDVSAVEDVLSRARTAMDNNDYPSAIDFTKEGLETITEDLRSAIDRELLEAEDVLRTAQELGADGTKAAGLIDRARGDLDALEFEKARNALRQSRAESERSLHKTLEGKVGEFSRVINEAKGVGADTSAAEGLFEKAEAAIRQRNFKEAAPLAKQGFQVLQEAQYQRVVRTIAASREKFVTAVSLGIDLSSAISHLNRSRECLQRNAFREALDAAKKADDEVERVVGRYRSAEVRLKDLHRAFAEAETFGVVTAGARRAADKAREAYQNRDPEGLDGSITEAFDLLRTAERDRALQAIQDSESLLALGERNGTPLGDASKVLEEAIVAAKTEEYRKALDLTGRSRAAAEAAAAQHLADGVTALRGALPHLGDDAATVKALVNRIEASTSGRDFEGAFAALEEARRAVEGHTRTEASQYVEDLGTAVQMSVNLGTDASGIEGLYRELNGHLGAGRTSEVLAAGDRVRSLLGTTSDNLFNLVRARVAQARDLKIDIEEMRELLKRSKMALAVESYHDGLTVLKECNDKASKATAIHRQTHTALASAAALAAEARKKDVDVTKVLEILLDAKKAFERLDYESTVALAARARAETEKLMVLYMSAQKVLSCRERMDLAGRLGIDAPHLRDALTEAKEAMKAKEYERALRAAERVEADVTVLLKERLTTIVGQAEGAVASVPGVNLAAMNDEIAKAKAAIDGARFPAAVEGAIHLKESLERLQSQGDEATGAIRRVREVVTEIEAMNVELPATLRLLENADRAYRMGQFEEAADYAAAAEAEAAKERDESIAATMRRFEDSIARARQEGTDTRSAEKLIERAREFLRGKKYRHALSIAMQSEAETERVALQQGLAGQAVETAERKAKGLAAPAPAVEKLVDDARQAYSEGDYVKALDTAIRATDALNIVRDELADCQQLRDRVQTLLQSAEDIGADAIKLQRIFAEGEAAFKAGDVVAARAAYSQSEEWGVGLLRAHLKDLLAKGDALVETCKKLGVNPTPTQNQFAEARARIDTQDFAEAYMLIAEGRNLAERAVGQRLSAQLSEASANIAHAKKLGTDAREAEERLRQANERIQRGEFETALGLVERALEHVESVKVVEKRFIDLTYKAESTIRNGRKFGIDMRTAEKKLADAIGLRKSNLTEAIKMAEESYRLGWEAVEAFAPELEASLQMGPAQLNEWVDATLTITNVGRGLAKDVRVKILGDAETEGLKDILAIRAKGQEQLKLRAKMTAPGSVPLAIQITSHRVFDDKAYTREMIAQIEVASEAKDKPKKVVADLESRCPICKGMIKKGFKVLKCGCGRDFHELCASRVGRCPVCFRSLAGAAE